MSGMFRMETAMNSFEKNGKVAKITENGSYKVILYRQPEKQEEGLYLLEVFKMVPKGEKAPETPEFSLRYDSLPRALMVANQALRGGLDTLLLLHRPNFNA